MTAAIGRRAWRAVRHAASAIRKAHDEQVYMRECFWRSGRAVPLQPHPTRRYLAVMLNVVFPLDDPSRPVRVTTEGGYQGWASQCRRSAAVNSVARSSGKNRRAPASSTTWVAPGMVSRSQ